MHQIDTDGHVANLFNEGDPGVPRNPTQVDKHWLNAVQEELMNLLTVAAVAPVKGTWTQVLAALTVLFARYSSTTHAFTATAPAIDFNGSGLMTLAFSHANHSVAVYVKGRELWLVQNAVWTGSQWNRALTGKDATAILLSDHDNSNGVMFLRSPSGTDTNIAWSSYVIGAGVGPVKVDVEAPLSSTPIVTVAGFENTWVDSNLAGIAVAHIRKDPTGRCFFGGGVKAGASSSGARICQLATAYRPTALRYVAARNWTANAQVTLRVQTDGIVNIAEAVNVNDNILLDGVNFA